MSFTPYLHFDGTCAAAFNAYAQIFGSDKLQLLTFAEGAGDSGMPASDRILHAELQINGQVLMGSDGPEGMSVAPQASVSISHQAPSVEEGQRVFDSLQEGGEVRMPFAPSFFAASFGMLKDRFGTHWLVVVNH
jgi:PhnB protein